MYKLLFGVILVSVVEICNLSAQSCLPNGVLLSRQGQIDSFPVLYPECRVIHGRVVIEGEEIYNLDSLKYIDSIQNGITIQNTTQLSTLSGLENLKYVGKSLVVINNSSLVSIDTLSALYLSDSLFIGWNPLLEKLPAWETTTSLKTLGIYSNSSLKVIDGLENLTHISNVRIAYNLNLEKFESINNVDSIDVIYFYDNFLLKSITGFQNVKFAKKVLISYCSSLEDISGFNTLESVQFDFDISRCGFKILNGFNSLVNAGEFTIQENKSLKSIDGFNSLKWLSGSLSVAICDSLISIGGFQALDSIGFGGLYLHQLPRVALLNFSKLKSIDLDLLIDGSGMLENIDGFFELKFVGGQIIISNNSVLTNINSLNNITNLPEELHITNNNLLSACNIFPVCNFLQNSQIELCEIYNNAPGCQSAEEQIPICNGKIIAVKVAVSDGGCNFDASSTLVKNVIVKKASNGHEVLKSTQGNQAAIFPAPPQSLNVLTVPEFPTSSWGVCFDTIYIDLDTITDTARVTFLLTPLNNCPQLHTELQLPPFFRGCLVNSTISVTNQNVGGTTAENTLVGVVIPSTLEVVTITPPVFSTSGDTLFFQTGNLNPFQTSTVNITVHTSCDTFLLGRTICLEAFGYLDNPCPPLPEASDVRVYSECLSDTTIRFTLKNILGGSTQNPHEYIIIEDEIVLMTSPFNLGPFGTMTVDVPANAATYRMEATRLEDGTLTATAREGCGGFTPGLITAFWLNTHLSDYDYDCREVILAYDPNQKTAIPKGIGEQHLLPKNTPITYNIEFQNTGTDTAFRVLLRDILSENLDVTTFRPLSATHPYTWEIRGGDTLEVLFQPIALPDSNVNEVASHGYFTFNINQKKDLPDGTLIENTASIIFDYNPPIITNTTFHTIGELTVGTTYLPDHQQNSLWKVSGNPVDQKAVFTSIQALSGTQHFSLMNAAGTPVKDQFFTDRRFEFDRMQLPAGLYYYTITDERGGVSGGKLVLE